MQTATFEIDGMHCDGCAQIVRHVLERQPGVKGCSVSLDSSNARVVYDPHQISAAAITETLGKAGYGAKASGE